MNKLAIVILSYNSADDVILMLSSVSENDRHLFKFIVVDNDSMDRDQLREGLRAFDGLGICYVENSSNVGYGMGNLAGLREAASLGLGTALVVNPDVSILDWKELYRVAKIELRKPEYVCVGISVAGVSPYLAKQKLLTIVFPIIARRLIDPLRQFLSRKDFAHQSVINVGRVHGCAVILNVNLFIRENLLDSNIFLYNEEILWSIRLSKLGFNCHQYIGFEVDHRVMGSSPGFSRKQFRCRVDSLTYIIEQEFGLSSTISRVLAVFATAQVYLSFKIRRFLKGELAIFRRRGR